MRRAIASCFLAGTFALGGGVARGDDGLSDGVGKWFRNPFTKEVQPVSSRRPIGGGTPRIAHTTAPPATADAPSQPGESVGKPPGLARRLPGPRAARVTLADDVSEIDPMGPGIDAKASESTETSLAERTPASSRTRLIQRRASPAAREPGRQTPTTARRKTTADSRDAVPGLSVDKGELEEVQVISEHPERAPPKHESPKATPADDERKREPVKARITADSSERPALSQRLNSWWNAKK